MTLNLVLITVVVWQLWTVEIFKLFLGFLYFGILLITQK